MMPPVTCCGSRANLPCQYCSSARPAPAGPMPRAWCITSPRAAIVPLCGSLVPRVTVCSIGEMRIESFRSGTLYLNAVHVASKPLKASICRFIESRARRKDLPSLE